MVGYRGVDGDVSLNCPEVVKVLEECDDVLTPEPSRRWLPRTGRVHIDSNYRVLTLVVTLRFPSWTIWRKLGRRLGMI